MFYWKLTGDENFARADCARDTELFNRSLVGVLLKKELFVDASGVEQLVFRLGFFVTLGVLLLTDFLGF